LRLVVQTRATAMFIKFEGTKAVGVVYTQQGISESNIERPIMTSRCQPSMTFPYPPAHGQARRRTRVTV
jgi:hypothetical protein